MSSCASLYIALHYLFHLIFSLFGSLDVVLPLYLLICIKTGVTAVGCTRLNPKRNSLVLETARNTIRKNSRSKRGQLAAEHVQRNSL
jgi:hypothetical protein